MGNKEEYLTFTRYKTSYLDKLFEEVKKEAKVDALGYDKHMKGVAQKRTYYRRDFVVYDVSETKTGIREVPPPEKYFMIKRATPSKKEGPLYISVNTGIRNARAGMAFRLSRLMINFAARVGKEVGNVSAELYDVSIGLPADKMFGVYDDKSFRKYTYSGGVALIPKLSVLLKDLSTILFEYRQFPWEDNKYGKRLKRYIVLLFIEDMTKKGITKKQKEIRALIESRLERGDSPLVKAVGLLKSRIVTKQNRLQFREFMDTCLSTLRELDKVCTTVRDFIRDDGRLYL